MALTPSSPMLLQPNCSMYRRKKGGEEGGRKGGRREGGREEEGREEGGRREGRRDKKSNMNIQQFI